MLRTLPLLPWLLACVVAAPKADVAPTPPIVKFPPGAVAKAIALKSPRPVYPDEARKHHWTGVGWYVMHVDRATGVVTRVEITQSCGHKILDKAATDAFIQWRFKPGTVKKVRTPVTWTGTD